MHNTPAELTASTPFGLLWLIPVLPLIGAAINGLFGAQLMKRFGPKINHRIAILLPTVSFLITVWAFFKLLGLPAETRVLSNNLFPFLHIGLFDADLAFWFDTLSATMTLVVTGVGTLIHVYSIGYMKDDASYWRFFAYLNLFMASMLTLVLGDNFLVMFIGWEGVGLCSYLLIAFWYKEKSNAVAGMKAFVVNRVGDFGFVIGIALLFWGLAGSYSGDSYHTDRIGMVPLSSVHKKGIEQERGLETGLVCRQYGCQIPLATGETYRSPASTTPFVQRSNRAPPTSLRFDAVRAAIANNESAWAANTSRKNIFGVALITLICLFLFLGAAGKSAQLPLYVWLPDAMAGPTPVSALIHAATMVTAGVYMVARCNFLFALSPTAMTVVALVGAVTALYAATIGLFQYDIKKVLAYSTVSQLGYMFIGVGVGAYWAGVYHLVTHAVFKALLFLGSGSVILGCHHEQDMRKMGGLKKYMPITRWTYLFACIAITTAPIPLLANGFFSKDEILWKAFDAQHLLVPGWVIWLIGFIGAGLTAFYMWRSYFMTFTGEYRGAKESHGDEHHGHGGPPHESHWTMTSVLVTLAVLIIPTAALGFWPLLHIEPLFQQWLHPVLGARDSLDTWWRSQTENVYALEWILALASVGIAFVGLTLAWRLYKDAKSPIPGRLLESRSPLVRAPHTLIFNKYYVDELYDFLFVRRARQLANVLFWFDQQIVDGLVNFAGFVGRMLGALDGLIDAVIVDGAVNGVAHVVKGSGRRIRKLQTGRIQTYLTGLAVGLVLLIVVSYFLT